MTAIQPISDNAIRAARLKRIVADLILEIDDLEATDGNRAKKNPSVAMDEFLAAIDKPRRKRKLNEHHLQKLI